MYCRESKDMSYGINMDESLEIAPRPSLSLEELNSWLRSTTLLVRPVILMCVEQYPWEVSIYVHEGKTCPKGCLRLLVIRDVSEMESSTVQDADRFAAISQHRAMESTKVLAWCSKRLGQPWVFARLKLETFRVLGFLKFEQLVVFWYSDAWTYVSQSTDLYFGLGVRSLNALHSLMSFNSCSCWISAI